VDGRRGAAECRRTAGERERAFAIRRLARAFAGALETAMAAEDTESLPVDFLSPAS